jgi:hypothetical protein
VSDPVDDLIVRACFDGERKIKDIRVTNGRYIKEGADDNSCIRTFNEGDRTFLIMSTNHSPGQPFNGGEGPHVAAYLTRNQTLALVRALLETLRPDDE